MENSTETALYGIHQGNVETEIEKETENLWNAYLSIDVISKREYEPPNAELRKYLKESGKFQAYRNSWKKSMNMKFGLRMKICTFIKCLMPDQCRGIISDQNF